MFKVSLESDSLFQKLLANSVTTQKEMAFRLSDGTTRVGFVTGVDEENVQFTETNPTTLDRVLLVRSKIVEVRASGKCLADYPKKTQKKVESFSYALAKECQEAFKRSRIKTVSA